jgi:hypothetical protein
VKGWQVPSYYFAVFILGIVSERSTCLETTRVCSYSGLLCQQNTAPEPALACT